MSEQPLLLPIDDAAKLAGVGRDRARKLIKSGEWESVRLGKRKRLVPRAFLEAKYGTAFAQKATEEASDA